MTKVVEMTVRDIMQEDVTTVSPGTPVRELTRILSDQGISGAPVVNSAGAVLGVVSSTDVVRLAAEAGDLQVPVPVWPRRRADWGREPEDEEGLPEELSADFFLPEEGTDALYGWDDELGNTAFDEFTVSDIMTPVSFTMPPTASVKELADFLLRGRIHRAVVTEDDHLVGIVTTMDVLRAMAEGEL